MSVLRAAVCGVIIFIATGLVHAQDVRDTIGPLEKSATQSSPENPIPRRLSAPPAARVQEWQGLPAGYGLVRVIDEHSIRKLNKRLRQAADFGNVPGSRSTRAVYPQSAQAERVAGMVVLEVIIGTDGKVREGRVMRSVAFLDEAAIEAVRQWEYTPTELDGKPVPVVMTVTVTFNLDKVPFEPPLTVFPWPAAEGAVRAGLGGTVDIPRQTKNARADFPSKARSAGRTGGAVLLELLIGTNGRVTNVRVLRSSPLFDNEAIEAARKWEFEPTLVNGVPTPVVVPATVTFSTR